jgi:hypothetical protein
MLVAGVRHSSGCNGGGTGATDTEVVVVVVAETERGGGRGRGRDEAVTHASHRCQALKRSQWRHQCDPDTKDIDMV